LRSMTGYGESLVRENGVEVSVQIKTLNHRFLQISANYPEKLPWKIERGIEDKIKEKISRGKVFLDLHITGIDSETIEVEPDIQLALSYLKALKKLKEKLNLNQDVNLSDFLTIPNIIKIKEKTSEKAEKVIKKAVEKALEQLLQSREKEGEKHLREIQKCLREVKKAVNLIKKEIPSARKLYREKIEEELKKIFPQEESSLTLSQATSKLALILTKGDITEEIVRLNFHLSQLTKTLKQKGPVGKKLGFILQELQREINTIGAKSLSSGISKQVIKIKDGIEKIREQVCNIE